MQIYVQGDLTRSVRIEPENEIRQTRALTATRPRRCIKSIKVSYLTQSNEKEAVERTITTGAVDTAYFYIGNWIGALNTSLGCIKRRPSDYFMENF